MLKNTGIILLYVFAGIGVFLTVGFLAVKFGLTKTSGVIDNQRSAFLENHATTSWQKTTPVWATGEEWGVLEAAILRDKESIIRAGEFAHVPPRLTVTQLVVEQLRLFYSNRELFKTAFAPLKLLGNQSQFSWGVVGIKQETAVLTEEHLKNKTSPFYPGVAYEHLLDFRTKDHDTERFDRIINENDRFYSYLYAAVYLREIITQWKNAGYDISDRPDILSTLYNIGFANSRPNANPQSGGAAIEIGDTTYSFGGLAEEFYNSDLLIVDFPRNEALW